MTSTREALAAGVTDATKAAMRDWISAFRQGGQRQSWVGMIGGGSRHQQRRALSLAPQSKRAPHVEQVLEVMRREGGRRYGGVSGQSTPRIAPTLLG